MRGLEIRTLEDVAGEVLLEINRACPIEADFTLLFDRAPDFYAWPRAVFDDFRYSGAFQNGELVGYSMVAWRRGLADGEYRTCVYGGDMRVVPKARGLGIGRALAQAGRESCPEDTAAGFAIVKEGNTPATRLVNKPGWVGAAIEPTRLPSLVAYNVFALRAPATVSSLRVRPAEPADLEPLAELSRRAAAGRLFAPETTPESLAELRQKVDRLWVAERAGRIVGGVAAWEQTPLRQTRVLRFSAVGKLLRLAYAGAAKLVGGAPAPSAGEVLRSLTLTHLAIEERAPEVLAALVAQGVHEARARGAHLVSLALHAEDPLQAGLRGLWLQRLRSAVMSIPRKADSRPLPPSELRDPVYDLAYL